MEDKDREELAKIKKRLSKAYGPLKHAHCLADRRFLLRLVERLVEEKARTAERIKRCGELDHCLEVVVEPSNTRAFVECTACGVSVAELL